MSIVERRRSVASLRSASSLATTLAALVAAVFVALPLAAQVPTQPTPRTPAPRGGQPAPVTEAGVATGRSIDDTAALGTFVDAVMKAHVEQLHIPAAVISIVHNGRVLYAKGYGNANVQAGTPIDPATSLFRIGSISKLFTWTAIMQLVEQGKVDLDGDVNRYLKTFKIPDAFGKPVTIRSLMTHASGFEEGAFGYLIKEDSTEVEPIEQALRVHMPARVRPPFLLSSYSNYGAALAGLIVEQVSGTPFNDYVKTNILDPLAMQHATFYEPLPAALRKDSVTGYEYERGVYAPKKFEYVGGFRPAGSVSASAVDMTHFMLAHLNDGAYGSTRILKPETAQLMHKAAFANDPRLPAMALGFYEQRINGMRIIGHGGDTQHFHSLMYLVPDQQLGIFVSYVGVGGGAARDGLMRAVFDRYYPEAADPPAPKVADFMSTVKNDLGSYRFARHSSTKIEKALTVASSGISVAPLPKQNRLLVSGLGAQPLQFVPRPDGLFQQVDGHLLIGFRTDTTGVRRLAVDEYPFMGTEPIPWSESPSMWMWLLALSTLLFISVLLGMYYRRRDIRAMAPPQKRTARLEQLVALWFFGTIIVIGIVIAANSATLFSHVPTSLKVSLIMPVIFVLLTVLLLVAMVLAWVRAVGTTGWRVHLTLVTLAAIAVSLFFNTWNILGWRFG